MTESPRGLSGPEVAERLKRFGPNRVSTADWRTALGEILRLVSDPQALMLVGLAVVYFALGKSTDGWIMLGAVVPILGMGAVLDLRTRKALRALHAAWRPWVHVIRDGTVQRIESESVVPDDILVLEEGEWLPADGVILEAHGLSIDESSLTGESAPVAKTVSSGDGDRNVGRFSAGTTVLTGKGLGRVTATGKHSQLGNLSALVLESETARSPLQKLIRRIVWRLAWLAVLISAMVLGLEMWRYGFSGETLVRALTIAMSIIPEEFPVVFTLFLSMGAWRLSRQGVLIRDLPSVETLGRTTVLATDKTGTLTLGQFKLTDVRPWPESGSAAEKPNSDFWSLVLMTCEPQIVDPMEKAMSTAALSAGAKIPDGWRLIEDPPFDPVTKTMFHVWQGPSRETRRVSKGAFEGIARMVEWSPGEEALAFRKLDEMTRLGLRVLALADGNRFAGFLGFSDPIRTGVADALDLCRRAGIDVRIVTGDDLRTARTVAEQVGLSTEHAAVTGSQLKALRGEQRRRAFMSSSLFARVLPEQKYELVTTLKQAGEVVAVTGDGVNDAAALKAADIGISMGARATELARASARMILLHDDFGSLVSALIEGRKIFANLIRVFSYLIAFHVPLALVSLVIPLVGWPAVILPIHILVLELVLHPVMALLFESAVGKSDAEWIEGEASGSVFLTRTAVLRALWTGLMAAAMVLGVVAWGFSKGLGEDQIRAVTFAAIMTANFVLCWVELNGGEPVWKWSWRRGPRFWIVNATVLALVMACFYWPALAKVMKLAPLPWEQWFVLGALSAALFSWRWLGLVRSQ